MICENEVCTAKAVPGGRECPACVTYKYTYRSERPVNLRRWPGVGHPLATTKDVVKLTGLTYRQVTLPLMRGDLIPTVLGTDSGHPHGWSVDDVVDMLVEHVERKTDGIVGKWRGVDVTVDRDQLTEFVVQRWPEGKAMAWDHQMEEVA